MLKTPDTQLIARAQHDSRQFAQLYQKYALKVYNYFWYRLHQDNDLAKDLTQETFLKAFEHLTHFQSHGHSYLTYLLKIAHNILVNQYRRPSTLSLDSLANAEDIPEEITGTDQDKERLELAWRAVNALPPQEKDLMLLRYHKGLSVREVAHVVGKSENAVKLALSRIQRKLRHQAPNAAISKLGEHAATLQPLSFL
ncbi:MAG: hypothetical protein A2542_03295 [Parcubacteria group bacterium RIFOXYD2_FULL_52_8]|nr:MAG: hypothetical protein A2542_03295 [Parcubacteria group bacterium RIFOXYD2_FULL_52_8]